MFETRTDIISQREFIDLGGRKMGQRRILQGMSVAILGLALACAPMAMASAHGHKAKHHKAKHHTTHTASKKGSDPTSSICQAVNSAQSSSGNLGTALEKVFTDGGLSNFAAAKQAMLAAMNAALKEEGPAESALRSAPSNVQAAMKGLFTFESSLETAISNAANVQQLEASLVTLGQNPALKTDSLTLANYVTSLCGTVTTTT
jgi:hypothetical protein